MFTSLQKILPKAIAKLGVKREVEAALICEKYRKFAPEVIHAEILSHAAPKFFQNYTLTIGVENAAWAAKVKMHEQELLAAMNRSLGHTMVKKIATRVQVPEVR